MSKIKLDLDVVSREGRVILVVLERIIEEAVNKRIKLVDIVSLEKNAELKKQVLHFLAQPRIKQLYHRVENDDKNSGRILVHFRLRSNRKKIGLYGYSIAKKK